MGCGNAAVGRTGVRATFIDDRDTPNLLGPHGVHDPVDVLVCAARCELAGAHCSTICDGAMPTFMLAHWTRDRSRGPKMPLEWMVHKQTQHAAELRKMIFWALTQGQQSQFAAKLTFAPMSTVKPVLVAAEKTLKQIHT